MSLRLQMLQVARLAPRVLGESSDLVRAFASSRFLTAGGAVDRAGCVDLYYTIFALALRDALGISGEPPGLRAWLEGFGPGDGLDFIHLGALARCRAAAGMQAGSGLLLARIGEFRTPDGGFHETRGAKHGHAYGCFVALGAYQDAGEEMPEPLRMVQCLKLLETPDGAWGNVRGMRAGTVPATAAAVTLLHQLGLPLAESPAAWLLSRQHESGGWLAAPGAPVPDLLSTATALHALACMDRALDGSRRERCLDFVDSLWSAEGGFHGHWADDDLDAEYTFYGLLALGHLA